ncbi:MAG TPA: GGDEF domain-containing protein, partial [Rubrivivax sp.]|nr:GGDEF domain-containing protein [Rubrivivax sp.]
MRCTAARVVLRRALAACLVGLVLPAWAQSTLPERIDKLLRQGYDRPDAALAALQALDLPHADAATEGQLLLARAWVLAQSGRETEAMGWAGALRTHASRRGDTQSEAAASLVKALVAYNAAQLDVAATLARQARDGFQPYCPALGDEATPGGRSGAVADASPAALARCDYRAAWQALQILQHHAVRTGAWPRASAQARLARDLAAWAGDDYRLASSTAELAWLTARSEGFDSAWPLLRQAQRLAQRSADPVLRVRAKLAEAQITSQRGELDGVRRLAQEALPLARSAGSPRLEATVLSLLSDAYAKQGRAADALHAAERGLPIVRRHADRHTEMVLTHNAGLAKIGLRRSAEGLLDLARVEELVRGAGLTAQHAQVLREYDEAMSAAGDARGALALYHRERELSAEAMRQNRDATLQQLQSRNHRERQQRDIDLQARDNQLKASALANRELMRSVWAVAALVLLLSVMMVALWYRRLRATHRQLVCSQAQLRVQSERDPLTHLANRRHFLSVMQTSRTLGAAERGFEGAMLLVDIDHFKHVNDGHGHAAGDLVLCEVARRLNEAVRGDDLVVRWGGEEFL